MLLAAVGFHLVLPAGLLWLTHGALRDAGRIRQLAALLNKVLRTATRMQTIMHFAHWACWYCCDFMVNLGNRTHSSYDEATTWYCYSCCRGC
ncbi:MAG: hypothetical protein EOO36_07050 [Cytophagaceae bacterium]|nr:MAG: hypothetical protein EOO36_07050 [Cytophagaceae bacterium]